MKLDERGVSPVVGTILLIAITVAVAGVVGYFAMTQKPGEPAPTVSVEFDNVHASNYTGSGGFTITHLGGDNIENANLEIKVAGSPVGYSITGGDGFSVGDVITVDNNGSLDLSSGDKIMLIHKPSNSALASTEVE